MTPLEDLLRQCTVKITVPGGWGTGFFVAPELILTCAHVVRKATDLQVEYREAVVLGIGSARSIEDFRYAKE